MTTEREALKLALEALKQIDAAMPFPVAKLAIMEAEKALAQPEQEPVGEVLDDEIDWFSFVPSAGSLIYTTPPPVPEAHKRTWIGLTDEERDDIILNSTSKNKAVAKTEAKLKEKNT